MTQKPTIRAVLWDMDGTLVLTDPLFIEGLHAVGATAEMWDALDSPAHPCTPRRLWEDMVANHGCTMDYAEFERMTWAAYNDALHRLEPREGVREALAEVAARGLPQAVVTNGHRSMAEDNLHITGLRPWFRFLVTADDVKRRKPHPEPYLAAASRLGLKPEECLAVENDRRGIIAAKAAEMQTVLWPDRGDTAPETDWVIANAAELCRVLDHQRKLPRGATTDMTDDFMPPEMLGGRPASRATRKIRLVIWDVDGTLVDSEPRHIAAVTELARRHGYTLTLDEYAGFLGQSFAQTVADIRRLSQTGATLNDLRAELRQIYAEQSIELAPRKGARPVMRFLDRLGIKQAALSNAPRNQMDENLATLGAQRGLLEMTVSLDETPAPKPDPAGAKWIADTLGVPFDQCMLVDDTITGCTAGRRAGMFVVACPTISKGDFSDVADFIIPKSPGDRLSGKFWLDLTGAGCGKRGCGRASGPGAGLAPR